jgi:ubiquinone/menaquinone biosynthesis C-methylase UbiE
MSADPLAGFDALAATYDQQWTHAPAGRLQRQAVWRQLDRLVNPADKLLDLGCGTGEDATHFASLGASVLAVDSSMEMVAKARAKGANAHCLRVEEITSLSGTYDLVLSNFGVLNCVRDLASLRRPLARMIRLKGFLAICFMGRFCLWESVYFATQIQFRKAARRWPGAATASIGLRVHYPSVRQVREALAPDFELITDVGIGVAVPPSFVPELSVSLLSYLGRIDQATGIARWGRSVADHRLLVFRRV